MAESTPQVKRDPGRRRIDYVRQKSAWILIVGLLVQGGFYALNSKLLTLGEDQLNRERALLVQQHTELVGEFAELGRRVAGLEARAGELAEAAGTVRGVVMQRYRCPDLTCPRCPACPPAPPGPVIVTSPAATLPLPLPEVAPYQAPPARDSKGRPQPRREP